MAKLIFCLTPDETLEFPLHEGVTRLGRNPSNEIAINNTWVSSWHAEFERCGEVITLRDLESSNGTGINGTRTSGLQTLKDGDRISLGQLEATFMAHSLPANLRGRDERGDLLTGNSRNGQGELAAANTNLQEVREETAALSGEAVALEAARESARATVAALESRQSTLADEIAASQSRLDLLRRETEGAEALNAKVADLRQQQAEAERRLEYLNDRLAGASEAPDLNWGTVHSLARSFIKKLDLIDDLISHLKGKPEGATTLGQLQIFREGLIDILKAYSIESYSLEPGTMIDVAARKRIQIVETLSSEGQEGTRIVRTYRPGYVCLNGELGLSTLLRKADVSVAIPVA